MGDEYIIAAPEVILQVRNTALLGMSVFYVWKFMTLGKIHLE